MPPKRETTSRTRSKPSTSCNDVDALAKHLASGLTLKGKQKAVNAEDTRVAAMRTVNAVSKQLSALLDKPSSRVTVKIGDARKGLRMLREDGRSGVDVERAASSLVAKLVALNKHNDALSLLSDMHPALVALYHPGPCPSSLASLPLPPPSDSDVLLPLLASYLLHSIQLSPQSILSADNTLFHWIPYLPSKLLDGILTKAYSALSKSKSQAQDSDGFTVRIYALKCLLHTSIGVLSDPAKFWSELLNVLSSFSPSVAPSLVLSALGDIVSLVQQRSDAPAFFAASTWPRVVDGWCSMAKQAADMTALARMSGLLPSSSTPFTQHTTPPQLEDAHEATASSEAESARLCTLLARLEVSFSSEGHDLPHDLDSSEVIVQTRPFLSANTKWAEKVYRALERVRRLVCKSLESNQSQMHASALVKCIADVLTSIPNHDSRIKSSALDTFFTLARTTATSALSDPTSTFDEPFHLLDRARRLLSSSSSSEELLITDDPNLDPEHVRMLANAYYALAGTLYKASKFDFAVRFLERACRCSSVALRLFDSRPRKDVDAGEENENEGESEGWRLLRETLYKRYEVLGVCHSKTGDRKMAYEAFVNAIAAFPYNTRASGMLSTSTSTSGSLLLDSQVATLVDRVTYMGTCELFLEPKEVSLRSRMNNHCQLAMMSASATRMSRSKRPLQAQATSVTRAKAKGRPGAKRAEAEPEKSVVDVDDQRRLYTGAILERQMDSLDASRYKGLVRKTIGVLIEEALEVYSGARDGVRRAGALVRWLEHHYYSPAEEDEEGRRVEDVVKEVETLLSDSSPPSEPNPVVLQYLASAHLWHALHTHKQNDATQFPRVVDHAEEACKVLKTLLAQTPLQPRPSQAQRFSLPRVSFGSGSGTKRSPVNGRKVAGSGSPLTRRVGHSPVSRKVVGSPASPRVRTRAQLVVPAAPTKKGRRSRIAVSTRSTKAAAAVATSSRTTRGMRSGKAAEVNSVTPKAKNSLDPSMSARPVANELKTSPKTTTSLEILPKLLDLLRMVSELLGLLGHVITRIHVLSVIRRLSERNLASQPDDHVRASIDLAHEYVKLGKTQRAANVYSHVYNVAKNALIRNETRILYYLRYAELFGTVGNVLKSSSIYCEATAMADRLLTSEKGLSTAQKITARVSTLERAAVAASTFAVIQYSKDDPTTSLNGLLQSLRLYHRAIDTLIRLLPPPPTSAKDTTDSSNPFDMASMKAALPSAEETDNSKPPPLDQPQQKPFPQRSSLSSLELRISSGLLSTLFSLTQAYFARGSAREAEYFASQARDLAESLHAPAMICRALSRMGEIKLRMGKIDEAHECLSEAAALVSDVGVEAVDIARLRGEVVMKVRMESGDEVDQAKVMYEEAIKMLEELDQTFSALDGSPGPRKSLGNSPLSPRQAREEAFAPSLLVAVLRQNIALLHDAGEEYKALLERLRSLPATSETKAEENALLAKLTLDDAYARFRADMFLSSLAESPISVPMGMTGGRFASSPTTQEILGTLNAAEKLFWSDLALVARRGNVSHVRDSVISLALIRAFQTSLGKSGKQGATLAAHLLDSSAAITLGREILEAIQHKFPGVWNDDLQWPLLTPNGTVLPPPATRKTRVLSFDSDDDDDNIPDEAASSKVYWDYIASRYQAQIYGPAALSSSPTDSLPPNWTVVTLNLTSDENTLFLTRQRPNSEPLVFCVPLKNRREADDEEEDKLTFQDAMNELQEIIKLSDEGTRDAVKVKRDDKNARAQWWAVRTELDKRLKTFLENLEFCWLGAFKTILSEPTTLSSDVLSTFRGRVEKIFKHSLLRNQQDKKQLAGIRLSNTLLECFSALSPTCDSEELEDIAYFVLDLYQFHGVPVASSEIDIDHVTVELRSALEELNAIKAKTQTVQRTDEHMFLILDKNLQGIPWESIPILRGRSVSRIPSLSFLLDRLALARFQRGKALDSPTSEHLDRILVNPRKTYFILNPSSDLKNTEGRFAPWLKEMKKSVGWDGIIGRAPSEQEFVDALKREDLVIYFGHGGAEQYIRSHKVRHLPRCAATMLWGCSSGALRDMGDFDRVGTPYNYMLAGCPSLVANLWDVTDRDIDKFSQSVFDKLHMTADEILASKTGEEESIVRAIAQSRDSCKLKYLTGAAPVVYGIPFYL
ncbi:unnamed protein product [Somion occarium]|uniref:separase n=1 Tax=Somion occarium TaxID=3059160 RepID=A0ABP1CSQ2_9APHY